MSIWTSIVRLFALIAFCSVVIGAWEKWSLPAAIVTTLVVGPFIVLLTLALLLDLLAELLRD